MTLILRENFIFSISLIAYNKSSTKTLLKSCKCIYQLLIILLCINTTAFGSAIFFIITGGIFFINLINAYQHLLFIRLLLKLYILVERSFTYIIN